MYKIFKEIITTTMSNEQCVVHFDPVAHKYTYDGRELTSVTTWIKERFDKEFQAIYSSNAKATKNKNIKKGISNPTDLRHFWKLKGEKSSHVGNSTHILAEMYALCLKYDCLDELPMQTGYDQAILDVLTKVTERGWQIVGSEKRVWDLRYDLAGHIDMVCKHPKKGYMILDFKVTADLDKYFGNLRNELSHVKASAMNKYSCQLHTYNIIGKYNCPPEQLIIVQAKSNGDHHLRICEDYSKEIKEALKTRNDSNNNDLYY